MRPLAVACLIAALLPTAGFAQKPADRAERDYREALAALGEGHLRVAEQKLVHALSLAPQDDDVRLTLSQLLIDGGRRAEAYRLLQEGYARKAARFALPLARMQFEDGDYAAVMDTLGRTPAREGGNPWRDALFGAAARELGKYAEAVEAFNRALAADRGNPTWSIALAGCLSALDRDDEARVVLERAGSRTDVTAEQRELIGERLAELSERH